MRLSRPMVWACATAAGFWGALLSVIFASRPGFWGDFLAWWYGAGVLLRGGNPYVDLPKAAPWFISEPLFYPLTAIVAAVPVAPLPYRFALGVFFGVAAATLGYVVATRRPHLFPLFFSFPFLMAAQFGHWSPFLLAAAIVPALGFFAAVKPNVGIALAVARPSREMVIGCAVLVAISLVVLPRWPLDWLANMRTAPRHPTPMFTWLGAPLLLSVLRWRRPEARLLLAMALIPQTASFADQLVLFAIPSTRKESMILALCSLVGGLAWVMAVRNSTELPVLIGAPYLIAGMYLPALVLVLRRPNVTEAESS